MNLRGRSRLLFYALLGLGAALLVTVVVLLLVRAPSQRHPAAAPTTAPPAPTTAPPAPTTAPPATTTAPPATTPTPPATTAPPPATTAPPPATTTPGATTTSGLALTNVAVSALGPFSATITWQTNEPTTGRAAYGPAGMDPVLWSAADGPATTHSSTLTGLVFNLPYQARLTATTASGREVETSLDFTTPGPPESPTAAVANSAILVDGQPFFPLLVWGECPNTYPGDLGAGVNLFMENPCGGVSSQVEALAGHALSAGPVAEAGATGPGLIGWYYGDESDLHGSTLPDRPQYAGRLGFLTLSSHFYSHSGLLPQGRGIYPGLVAAADVVGFDLYPLQNWCRRSLADVYAAQQELVALAAGKPTYQWIETATMDCNAPALAVTPATVRAESWLAIAGGAHGLGFFPGQWTPAVGTAVQAVTRGVAELGPALTGPAAPASVTPAGGSVQVGARAYGGAVYVIAVNSGRRSEQATIGAAGLRDGPLSVVGEARTVSVAGGRFTDAFGPLAVHVYVQPPG